MTTLLLHLSDVDEPGWTERYREALPEVRVVRRGDDYDPARVDYAFVWKPKPEAFDGLTGLKAVLSLGAGVDALLKHPHLPAVPIVRFVDADLTEKMSDYVVAQVAMHQRLFTRFCRDQRARRWTQIYPPAASNTNVGIMGLGALGADAARRLLGLGFGVVGWSRTAKAIEGVTSFAGETEFDAFLAATDILVCLLPLTPDTTGILDYELFGKLRRKLDGGPAIVNAARGGHQREADIIKALRDGTLGAASLDVFEVETLPAASPLWSLDNCYVTP
ncbi:MAG: glyoxylate/hydroxypyruvate reductase A, partial [Devosia sp.]|nr:glyoxylate/hydroxypyruvate reductase A [Devosia sp.]